MDDLISREAAKSAIREKYLGLMERCEINEVLNAVPPVDAVPIVRCGKCKHYETYKGKHGRCKRHSIISLNGNFYVETFWINEDDYCSKGEQRDSE